MDCPECGKMIPSDVEKCPYCGKTITEEDKIKTDCHPLDNEKVKKKSKISAKYILLVLVGTPLGVVLFVLLAVDITIWVQDIIEDSKTHSEKQLEQVEAYIADKDNRNGVGSHNGHLWVDLGLPSGTLWATCDVGAPYSGQEGDRFAWGETQPIYSRENYKYEDENGRITKYYVNDDYLIRLQPSDDAATVNWGDGWRMPTAEEFKELYEWCMHMHGNGDFFIGPNGNVISLGAGYWSSSLNTKDVRDAIAFGEKKYGEERCRGYCVRAVCVASRN